MRRDIFTSFLRFFFMCMHAKTHRSVTIFSTLWDCQIYTWDSRNCGLVFLKLQQRIEWGILTQYTYREYQEGEFG